MEDKHLVIKENMNRKRTITVARAMSNTRVIIQIDDNDSNESSNISLTFSQVEKLLINLKSKI